MVGGSGKGGIVDLQPAVEHARRLGEARGKPLRAREAKLHAAGLPQGSPAYALVRPPRMGHGIIDSMWMTNGLLVYGRYVHSLFELHVAAARQQPREHMMSRWQSVCAAQTVSGGQWGEGSGWRIEHSEVRGTCPLHDT